MNEMMNLETMNEETKVIEEAVNEAELEGLDTDVEVIDDCTEPEDLEDAKKLLKRLGICGAIALLLVAVWKKVGKAAFMKLLASILRKSGWTVTEPAKTEVKTSEEEPSIDSEESEVEDESDDCEEVED